MPPAPTHASQTFGRKHEAAEYALKSGRPFVIVQASANFYVYHEPAKLDADAKAFAGHVNVIEIVLKERMRRPFVDVDGPHDVSAIVADLLERFGGSQVLQFKTTRGTHLIVEDAPLVTFREHAAGLLALKMNHDPIDAKALHSLRLPGTRKFGPNTVCKEHPTNRLLSELLCQPFDAPAADKEGPTIESLAQRDCVQIADDFAERVSVALSGHPDVFVKRECDNTVGILLDRVRPSFCKVCDRDHEKENAYAIVGDGCIYAYCHRNAKAVTIATNDKPPPNHPGRFNEVSAGTYSEAPAHSGGLGCYALSGDYIDGSPCGLGKSEAAWKSIAEGESVLCVSYRRAFTAKTAADYGLTVLGERGNLTYSYGKGTRAVVQLESLHRVEIENGALDVVIIDEWHGLMRQGWGGLSSARSRGATQRLEAVIQAARRVIVLDAYANDEDRKTFERLTRRPFQFGRNTYPVHHDKAITVHRKFEHVDAELFRWVARRSAGEKAVVFTHLRSRGPFSVEGVAARLQAAGLCVKYYHGKTSQVDRAADFADVEAAYEGVDVVVYNASVEAGVSIKIPAFTRLFCFSSRLGAVEVVAQAIHRFRCVTQIDYAGQSFGSSGYAPQTAAEVQEAYRRYVLGSRRVEFNLDNAPGTAAEALDSFAGRAWVETTLEAFRSAKYYDARLFHMLAGSGYKIKQAGAPAVAVVVPQNTALVSAELKNSPAQRIVDAAVLLADEADREENRTDAKTAEEIAAADRAAFCENFQVRPDALAAQMVEDFTGHEPAWRTYKALIADAPMLSWGRSAHASKHEAVARISDLTEALGLGRCDAIARVDPPVVPAAVFEKNATEGETAVRAFLKDWGYIVGNVRRPPMKTVTTRAVVGMLRTALERVCGLTVGNTDESHPKRGSYYIAPREWPAEFLIGVPLTIAAHRAVFAAMMVKPKPAEAPAVEVPAVEVPVAEAQCADVDILAELLA